MEAQPRKTVAGRFEIGDLIGRGGMGDVYLGTDLQSGQKVAIKVLRPDIVESDPSLLERFEREGEALRRLNHPNIVKVLAAFEEDGTHDIVMEYVSGGSLAELLEREGPLPVERVLEVALDLADALTRAHRLNIIHRDIKPANVLLAEDGTPRLTDFGVARIGDRTRLTQSGSIVGTYAYLSPEACMGADLDERSDIWSFGVMLYEMLAGRKPFSGEHPGAIVTEILTKQVPSLAEIRPDVPLPLIELIESMLEKEPEDRIRSVRMVGARLEAIIRGDEVTGPVLSDSAMERLLGSQLSSRFSTPTDARSVAQLESAGEGGKRRFGDLRVVAAIAVAVVALVAVAVFAFGGGAGGPVVVEPVEPGEYMVLVAQVEPLTENRRDVTRFIVDSLVQTFEVDVPFSNVRIREYPRIITSHEEAMEAAKANRATVVVWGNYTDEFIELEVMVGVTDEFPLIKIERDVIDRTANVRVRMTDERSESVAPQVLGVLDVLHTANGDGYEILRVLAILDVADVRGAEIVGSSIAAYLHRSLDLYLSDVAGAVEGLSAAIGLDAGNPILYGFRSSSYYRMGMIEEARQDIQTMERLAPPDWTIPLYLRGNDAFVSGDVDTAISYYERIAELRPDDWFPLTYLGALYYLEGDFETAKGLYERSIALGSNASWPYILSSMIALREGRISDATSLIDVILTEFPDPEFGMRLVSSFFGTNARDPWGPAFSAFINAMLGQYDDVLEYTEQALEEYQFADAYMLQGLAYCNLGDYEQAEAAYDNAIELEPDFAVLYLLRAEVRLKQGDQIGALADFGAATQLSPGGEFEAVLADASSGNIGCENFFSYRPSGQQPEGATEEASQGDS